MRATPASELAEGVKPLTETERRWVRRLGAVLKDMPQRLMLIETGDVIQVVDRAAANGVDLEDGKAERNGVMLSTVDNSTMKLTGVSG